jgi:hypothetical protein
MTITQTVEIPDNREITLKVPRELPTGRTILTFTPAPDPASLHPCPICASKIDPETGNPRFGPETIASIEEGRAMMRGEIPTNKFSSFGKMWEDLMSDNN